MPSRPPPCAADLPALTAFARGYLHEDVHAEYGSGLDAASAFVGDASPEELRQLIDELERVARAFTGRGAQRRIARFFTADLRASWTPATSADLHALIARLRRSDR
jgi:CdiI immunity protein